ncbi:hypothetical protein FX988_02181 [Paraglaciecola mesophila]|uniref:Twin-arginine translocation pathway signal n=1 Tax=Paraglaciecola mesophila TaxID=197222 RepID=A0A857JIT9_9ALTE|nr:gluconate 2-dehydrogenase subunit 3 family protein [Paraglaciecola mesophila]QHJ11945.1 hypothetical protein FX988_02181 [Paraglaciecola mesophila]
MNNNTDKSISRRDFLKNSIKTAAAGGGIAAVPGLIFSDALAAGSQASLFDQTLLRIARDIYPHDMLEDKYYTQPLVPLKETHLELLQQGVNALDRLAMSKKGAPFLAITEESEREALLRTIEETAFFSKMKFTLMLGIYNNPEVWPMFGYEGSSWEKGGYLHRGFNDLKWL